MYRTHSSLSIVENIRKMSRNWQTRNKCIHADIICIHYFICKSNGYILSNIEGLLTISVYAQRIFVLCCKVITIKTKVKMKTKSSKQQAHQPTKPPTINITSCSYCFHTRGVFRKGSFSWMSSRHREKFSLFQWILRMCFYTNLQSK